MRCLASSISTGSVTADEMVPSASADMGHIFRTRRAKSRRQRTHTSTVHAARNANTAPPSTSRYFASGSSTSSPKLPTIEDT